MTNGDQDVAGIGTGRVALAAFWGARWSLRTVGRVRTLSISSSVGLGSGPVGRFGDAGAQCVSGSVLGGSGSGARGKFDEIGHFWSL